MWHFEVTLTCSAGVRRLTLRAPTSDAVAGLALTVAARKGWQGASVLEAARLYRVTR